MDDDPVVSVVVASYNRCDGLERLLRGLADQAYPVDRFEAVVIDDGSTDGTQEMLAGLRLPYSLRFQSQANRGPAAARNRGVEHARGRFVLFLDDDVVPVPDLIARHVAAHGDSAARVVTGPMSPPPASWKQPIWDGWDAEQLQKQYRAMLAGAFACSQRQFFTANASLPRRMFVEAGGFDEAFRRAEDMDLAWRMSKLGAQFVFEPAAEVVHYASRPFGSWRRNAYQYGRYDVVMDRDKGVPVFRIACAEFHRRRPLNRWLTRLCVGRPPIRESTVAALILAVHLSQAVGATRVGWCALSCIFNVRYWQGMCDELGSAARLWAAVASPTTWRFSDGAEAIEGGDRRTSVHASAPAGEGSVTPRGSVAVGRRP